MTSKDGKYSSGARLLEHYIYDMQEGYISEFRAECMFRKNYCRLGGFTEWKVLYSLCKDEKGFLHKDTVRAVYDGSLFEKLEHERKSKTKESAKNK